MAAIKTDSNQPIPCEHNGDDMIGMLEHMDTVLHDVLRKVDKIDAFIDEHRPALARGMALLDPGAKLRGLMTGKKRD